MDRIEMFVGPAVLLATLGLFVVWVVRLACYDNDNDDVTKPQVASVAAPISLQPKCIDACTQRFERARLDWRRYCETNDDVKCDSTDGPRDWSVVFRAVDDQTTTCLCRIDSDTSAIW